MVLAFSLLRALASLRLVRSSALARSLDYLLAVASVEHTFANERFRADFPQLAAGEESIRDGFVRIAARERQRAAV